MSKDNEPAPEPAEGEPAPEGQSRKPRQVLLDEIKEQHTTHWDMDMLPRAEMEAIYAQQKRRRLRRRLVVIAGGLGAVITVVCGGALLALYLG